MNTSIKLDTPCEFINVVPLNPLISKCQIKVCYVGDDPNRNKSIITKEVAKELANSLPGSPIVGYYNEEKEDFEEHNRIIDISNGKFLIKDTTRPYGFVDLGAKVWFQKFLDYGVEHEYLMTEGYLWTGQYPEAKRIIDKGNNQSMELDENLLDAYWSKDKNGKPQFFIINEAIISKLCILGEDVEPCFEGSQITRVQFSFEDSFKQQLFSLINEMKEILSEGGTPVFTRYAVEIGESLWNSLYAFLRKDYSVDGDPYCLSVRIEGIYEEAGQKFAILQKREDNVYYRMDFNYDDSGLTSSGELVVVTKTFVPAETPQFEDSAVAAYAAELAKSEEPSEAEPAEVEPPVAEEEVLAEEEPVTIEEEVEEIPEEEDKPAQYNLDEIQEYIELNQKYSELETNYNNLVTERDSLKEEIKTLIEFKKSVEKKDKQAMIDSFYMLSDEDKKDVVANIDTYSLDDIEAKLSIICVRNKVNFNLDEDEHNSAPISFNLNGGIVTNDDSDIPAWIKLAASVEKEIKSK